MALDPRLRHQCGALRHRARQRAGAQSGPAATVRNHHHGNAREEIRGRLPLQPICSSASRARSASSAGSRSNCAAFPRPSRRRHCSFETVRGACQATILAIQTGIPVARIELLNAAQVRACNAYSKLSLPETSLLLLEFHGSANEVAEQSKNFSEIARECGGSDFTWTTRPEDHASSGRRGTTPIGRSRRCVRAPASRGDRRPVTDLAARRLHPADRSGLAPPQLQSPIVSHVGDIRCTTAHYCVTSMIRRDGARRGFKPSAGRAGAVDGRHLYPA